MQSSSIIGTVNENEKRQDYINFVCESIRQQGTDVFVSPIQGIISVQVDPAVFPQSNLEQ
jgi:hypothetical protein